MDSAPTDRPAKDTASATDDATLVAGLRRGDPLAYEQCVRRYGGAMLTAARRLVADTATAEDCVQEAFLSAFRAIDGFEQRAALGTWLHRITINTALMTLRRRKRRAEQPIDPLLPDFDRYSCRIEPAWQFPDSVEEALQRKEVRARITDAIDSLPDAYRTVLVLRDIEEMSTAEAAEAMETTEGAVKTRLHRARAALKRLLEPLWLEDLR